jgi:hypothetical protein
VDCRKLTDNAARLACYDQAAAALDQAEAKGDVVVVDREQARKVRKQAFGFTLPSISIFAKGESQEEVDNSTAWSPRPARRRRPLGDQAGGRRGLEPGRRRGAVQVPKPGMKVKIRKAALGSYMMDRRQPGRLQGPQGGVVHPA